MASSFTPDGKGVIYGTSDGRLYHWNLAGKNTEFGRHSVGAGKKFNRPRLIRFFKKDGADVFLSVAESGEVLFGTADGAGGWRVDPAGSVHEAFEKAFDGKTPHPPRQIHGLPGRPVRGRGLARLRLPAELPRLRLPPGRADPGRAGRLTSSAPWPGRRPAGWPSG